ncbi:MBL fold metallo-hydrolase [Dyadobacter subterraneus]|uniref:MBL fold metallo-hydrolase n=1 Tax=Dyadobacter subterraneus TaxID=2773304 RepID=A0ABR9W7E7_9BACT|nr:MBL fold metallo-hydrolase [Dyadobacter subterraneus]MBE9461392.1 MBL fold metallo-hydrolase [Dyadobacter subterraneus]
MNRRTALKNTALFGFSMPLFLNSGFQKRAAIANSFHKFRLGKLDLLVVSDGHILFENVQPDFAPDIAADKVSKALEYDFLSTKEVDLAINILVIKNGQKTILIDSGCGYHFGKSSGWLPDNLIGAGIKPENVTDVILSHAHPDHLGGLVNKEGKPVFPKAEVHISAIEKDFWLSAHPDFSKSKVKPELAGFVTKIAQDTLKNLKLHLRFFNDGDTLLDCIRIKLAPGHTPGHTVVNVFSGEDELFHVADLVHSAPLVVAHPDWGFEGDTDFDQAITTRKKVLQELAEGRKTIFSSHLPWPGLGHVRKQDEGFDWVQTTFAVPD